MALWVSVPLLPLIVGSPAVMAAGTEQGAKGVRFLPGANGETTVSPRGK